MIIITITLIITKNLFHNYAQDGIKIETVREIEEGGSYTEKKKLTAPSFDGVIIFDECHKAKNFEVRKDGDGGAEAKAKDTSSQTAKCVIELQRRLPKARIVYASATGVSQLSNFHYCDRLGKYFLQHYDYDYYSDYDYDYIIRSLGSRLRIRKFQSFP